MKIAIITGGSGLERDISIKSAKNIQESIDFTESKLFIYPEEYKNFLSEKDNFSIVVPVIHGNDGEDGALQEKLESISIPYLFSPPQAHRKCFNKIETKKIIRSLGILTPDILSSPDISEKDIPFIVKPKENGSSFKITLVENKEQLENIDFSEEYMYEPFIEGREFTVGVIEKDGEEVALPIMEIKKEKKIFDYEDKYSDVSSEIEVFPENYILENRLQEIALKIHKEIGLKHISRTDFIVRGDEIFVLEVNSIPGMTASSFIPKMLKKAWINLSELLNIWVNTTLNK